MDKKILSDKITTSLLDAQNYREFLREIFSLKKKCQKTFSYAHFSRMSGIKAKSFIHEVLTGKKRLTETSLPKFIKGLQLSPLQAKYFYILVANEEDFSSLNNTGRELTKKIEVLRSRLRDSLQQKIIDQTKLYKNFYIPFIYAALGPVDQGRTLDEISKILNFDIEECRKILKIMSDAKLISYNDKTLRYLSYTSHHTPSPQELNQKDFQNFFESITKKILSEAKGLEFSSKEKLFMNSVFSVSQSKLPTLKQKLQKVLIDFVDEEEESNGERIVYISLGMSFLDTKK